MQYFATTVTTIACILAPSMAFATTWYVSATGSDTNSGTSLNAPFATIQHAADQTQPGDAVMVLDGTYDVPCKGCDVVDITHSGTALAPIVYQAYPGQSPVVNFTNGWSGFNIEASYIVVDGFEVAGGRTRIDAHYALAHKHDLSNYLTSANGIVSCSGQGTPVYNHIVIQNNNVHDAPGAGIATCYADYVTIQHNISSRNAYWSPYASSGISIWEMRDSDSNTGTKNFILDNISTLNQEFVPFYAVGKITDGNGIIVDDNKNTQSGGAPYGGRTYVANNIATLNGGSGIHAYASAHVDIVYNTAYLNNQTRRLNEGQIFANTGTDINILSNILFAAPHRTYYSDYNNDPSVLYDYNLLYSTTPKAGEKGLPPGPHDILGNPLFNDPGAGDFTLQAASLAIGSASPDLAPATDFAGNPRPTPGGGYDRGAFQYQP